MRRALFYMPMLCYFYKKRIKITVCIVLFWSDPVFFRIFAH